MFKSDKPTKRSDNTAGKRSGRLFVELMRTSPLRDILIESPAVRAPVREVRLEEGEPT
jgi:hypothetical protein